MIFHSVFMLFFLKQRKKNCNIYFGYSSIVTIIKSICWNWFVFSLSLSYSFLFQLKITLKFFLCFSFFFSSWLVGCSLDTILWSFIIVVMITFQILEIFLRFFSDSNKLLNHQQFKRN